MKRIYLIVLCFLGVGTLPAQTQYFPADFSDDFSAEAILERGTQEILISSHLEQHPDSMKRMFVGHPELKFDNLPFEKYVFDKAGRVSHMVPFWDSSRVIIMDLGEGKSTVHYPKVHYTYDEQDRIVENCRIVQHLNVDSTITRFTYGVRADGQLDFKTRDQVLTHVRTEYEYYPEGKLKCKIQLTGKESTDRVVTTYSYPAAGETHIQVVAAYVERDIREVYNTAGQLIRKERTDTRTGEAPFQFPDEVLTYNEKGQLVTHILPMERGVTFHGSWPTAEMHLTYGADGELKQRIFYYGFWINTFSYSYN